MSTDASEVSFGGETVNATVAKFAMAASGFVGTILFARLLDPTLLGGFYLLLGLVKIADRPIHGWAIAAKKRFSEHDVRDESIVGAQIVFIIVWLVFVAAISFFLSGWLREYTKLTTAPLLFLLLLASEPLYEPFEKLLQARGQIGVATWLDTLRSYLTLPFQIWLVLAGFGTAGLVYGLAGATVLSLPAIFYYLHTPPALPTISVLRSLWRYAKYSVPSSFFGTIYDRFDVLLLGLLLTPTAAGYYEVAAKLTLPAIFVGNAAASGLMARVSNRRSKNQDVSADVYNALSFTSILAIPIFFGALALSQSLVVTFYGPRYAPAGALLIFIAAYRLLKSQNAPLTQTINGLNSPETTMRISAGTLAINIVLGVVLVLQIGAVGVAVATLIAEGARYLSLLTVVRGRIPGVRFLPRTLLEQFSAGVIMFLIVSLAHRIVPVRSWPDLFTLLAIGAAIYILTLLLVSSRLRQTIGSVLRGSQIERFVPHQILDW
ncbi:oligosaccharide flippase family protein [Haladaptatus caseinilyticus]|uniref:oligosaccharide flippase family protein n=1 Tax=Haladaptatus caseinilyticus TaxID=2993314 RepID=UPI00224AB582|nr:oligosaccharide flippase family protein [Haladaptatus caseinilyticus]